RQQWKVQDLDFTQDKIDNARQLEESNEAQQAQSKKTFASFFIGEEQVTWDLAPFMMALPDHEARVFLTTQMVDEARHMVFFDRYYSEVLQVPGQTLKQRLLDEKPKVYRAYDDIFYGQLAPYC